MSFAGNIQIFVALLALCFGARAQTNQAVYTDSLQNGWESWGWTKIDYANTTPVHAGTASISVTMTQAWQAMYLHNAGAAAGTFTNLSFWANGGSSGGQQVQVQAIVGGNTLPGVALPKLPTNTWQQFNLSFTALGVSPGSSIEGFWIQDRIGQSWPAFYVDDISLTGGTPPPPATNGPVNITIDVFSNRHVISELIYGVAFASSNELKELNAPLNRSGGNSETRYNWVTNAHNHANDWYFESLADSPATPGAAADSHVASTKAAGADPMMTVPMIGWLPKLGANRGRLASYSITKYGNQTGNDSQWFPDAGNGVIVSNGTNVSITWNDPNDANVLTDSTFQRAWVQHLTNVWSRATNGGVRYYCMDNEWSLWQSTHRDVHPVGPSMREMRDKFFDYAAQVKSVDPAAVLAAPEEWGWSGYFYSGYDQQWSGARSDYNPAHFPDRGTNSGWDFIPWFLDQCRQRATNTNQRLLDILTVHYYPQGGEFSDNVTTAMLARRDRSTRSLWDTNYTDETWISSKVQLIPRLKQWVATYYPGTKIGLTEYNWGAENHMNGATAQADVLGILGREGLDVATRWTTPSNATPTFKAMKLFRNYDNAKSTFGQTSVWANVPNPDVVSAFAAQRTNDNALTIVVINKTNALTPAVLSITNFLHAGIAQQWILETNAITRRADIVITANSLTNTLPAQSVTLLVIPAGASPRLRARDVTATNTMNASLLAEPGQRYVIEASTNFPNPTWSPILTNTLTTNDAAVSLPAGGTQKFYRAVWQP